MTACPKCGTTAQWMIRHPGKGTMLECESFEQAMKDWFEGFNPPILVTQAEIARMAEDAECDADAKASDGEYKIGNYL